MLAPSRTNRSPALPTGTVALTSCTVPSSLRILSLTPALLQAGESTRSPTDQHTPRKLKKMQLGGCILFSFVRNPPLGWAGAKAIIAYLKSRCTQTFSIWYVAGHFAQRRAFQSLHQTKRDREFAAAVCRLVGYHLQRTDSRSGRFEV